MTELEMIESIGFMKTYITSLKKDLTQKDLEIGKLSSYVEELEAEKRFVKGDRKSLKQQDIVKEYVTKLADARAQINRLKKDNELLIYKLNQNALLQKPQQ